MSRRTMALLLGLLVGCSMSLQEVRDTAPARTQIIANTQYDVLAGCAVEGFQTAPVPVFGTSLAHLLYVLNRRPDQGRATVTGYALGGDPPLNPTLDLTFAQRDGNVVVESRLGKYIGDARKFNELAWPIIEKCAGTTAGR